MINRYIVKSERDEWAAFVDKYVAQEWADTANLGACKHLGWRGNHFTVIVKQEELQRVDTWYF